MRHRKLNNETILYSIFKGFYWLFKKYMFLLLLLFKYAFNSYFNDPITPIDHKSSRSHRKNLKPQANYHTHKMRLFCESYARFKRVGLRGEDALKDKNLWLIYGCGQNALTDALFFGQILRLGSLDISVVLLSAQNYHYGYYFHVGSVLYTVDVLELASFHVLSINSNNQTPRCHRLICVEIVREIVRSSHIGNF